MSHHNTTRRRSMRKEALVLLTLFFAVTGFGQGEQGERKKESDVMKSEVKTVTLHGYVVDAMCAKRMAGKETTMKKAAAHTKDCALEESCASSGYGLFSDGTWYKFDPSGDALAKGLIEKGSREKGLAFAVTGKVEGDRLVVASMKEQHPKVEKKKAEAEKTQKND
jgi:hypothetical protein